MDHSQNIEELFKRYLLNQCEPREIKLLSQYFGDSRHEAKLKELIQTELESSQENEADVNTAFQEKVNDMFQLFKKKIQKK